MAIRLDTTTDPELEEQAREENAKHWFRRLQIGIGALMVLIVAYMAFSCVSLYSKIVKANEEYQVLEQEYSTIAVQKIQLEQDIDELDAQLENAENGETNKIHLNSAIEAGDKVAELQNLLVMNYASDPNNLPSDKRTELAALTGGSTCWYQFRTQELKESPPGIVWKFLTHYDSMDRSFSTAWACYDGTESYILMVVEATYTADDNGPGSFRTIGRYTTSFGKMYADSGIIEAGEYGTASGTQVGSEVESITDQLLGSDLFGDDDDNARPGEGGGGSAEQTMAPEPVRTPEPTIAPTPEPIPTATPEPTATPTPEPEEVSYISDNYVIDRDTLTLHYSKCPKVKDLANKSGEIPVKSAGTKAQLQDNYISCSTCDPLGVYH